MAKRSIWSCKCSKWRNDMASDFSSLTGDAGFCPLTDITVHSLSDIACSDQLLGCMDSWVGKTMQLVKNKTAKGGRNVRAW